MPGKSKPRSGTIDIQDRNPGWVSVNFGLLHGDHSETLGIGFISTNASLT